MDEAKLQSFLGKAVNDLGAAMSAALVLVGDELGLYEALAKEPLTSAELARKTGTSERYDREWLGNQAAGGYVQYDAAADRRIGILNHPAAPPAMARNSHCVKGASTSRWRIGVTSFVAAASSGMAS